MRKNNTFKIDWKNDHARPNLLGKTGWKGSIQFDGGVLFPVRLRDDLAETFRQKQSGPSAYLPRAYAIRKEMLGNSNFSVDICKFKYIGACDWFIGNKVGLPYNSDKRVYRIYFDPIKYPPPNNERAVNECTTFYTLRCNIRQVCRNAGSPVYCNGGGKNEKIFLCANNKKRLNKSGSGGTKRECCPFRFTIRWDKHGFYIHLMDNLQIHTNGCPFHLCSSRKK